MLEARSMLGYAHFEMSERADPKYTYDFKRNTLPIEERFGVSLEGLIPDAKILHDWADATKTIAEWVNAQNPEAILITGRSGVVVTKSMEMVGAKLQSPIYFFPEEENNIIYKDTLTELMTNEEFYDDYNSGGVSFSNGFVSRRSLIRNRFNVLPQKVVILDEITRSGLKAYYSKEFLEQQGISTVLIGTIVGPLETVLAKVGSTDPNLYCFMDNLSEVWVSLQDKEKLMHSEIPGDIQAEKKQIQQLINNAFENLQKVA
jgi:hypothetical protein